MEERRRMEEEERMRRMRRMQKQLKNSGFMFGSDQRRNGGRYNPYGGRYNPYAQEVKPTYSLRPPPRPSQSGIKQPFKNPWGKGKSRAESIRMEKKMEERERMKRMAEIRERMKRMEERERMKRMENFFRSSREMSPIL